MQSDMSLTIATVIHMAVTDFLYQKNFEMAHLPELVDLATVISGLGITASNVSFVEQNTRDWDITLWAHTRRGFLDQRAWSYASALAAWIRGEQHPRWARALRLDIRHPMNKSLRYLFKTGDSFFNRDSLSRPLSQITQDQWLDFAQEKSPSKQIIAIRRLQPDPRLADQQVSLLVEKLRHRNEFIALNAIWAVESMRLQSDAILEELRILVDHSSEEVRSKAAIALAHLKAIDEQTVDRLANMLDGNASFVLQSAAYALSSLDLVPDYVLAPMNKGLIRALQVCDYGLVAHFVNAFNRWIDEPESYFEKLLAEHSPELLGVAMDTLDQVRKPLTQLQ